MKNGDAPCGSCACPPFNGSSNSNANTLDANPGIISKPPATGIRTGQSIWYNDMRPCPRSSAPASITFDTPAFRPIKYEPKIKLSTINAKVSMPPISFTIITIDKTSNTAPASKKIPINCISLSLITHSTHFPKIRLNTPKNKHHPQKASVKNRKPV